MWTLIKTKEQYNAAMDRILELSELDLIENTPEFDEFELLSLLIEKYEEKKYPSNLINTDPIRIIKFYMEQNGLSNQDMVVYFGSPSKVSEVLNYKRKLNLKMIRKLHEGLHISIDLLTRDYLLKKVDFHEKININKLFFNESTLGFNIKVA
ncbi:helix-turn-helix domain-containing protein [Gallibacterium sp. AGMB14963]|uniref:helix-turn-helix domain-containing protein n=1 Tax=Gallibacterium faecale TaxID=3019086 RepID=UPI0022F151AB|nr:transcriptional regulator [Gallibacterium sp. AGMB14963]MDA3979545.1 transcriptional regulator [Gallibacterium sp. AGMB14963]